LAGVLAHPDRTIGIQGLFILTALTVWRLKRYDHIIGAGCKEMARTVTAAQHSI